MYDSDVVHVGTRTLIKLKSVFSEIQVMTWIQAVSLKKQGLWLADLAGLPITSVLFGRKQHELMSRLQIWEKNAFSLCSCSMYSIGYGHAWYN